MPAVYLEPRAEGMPGIRDDAGLALLTDQVAPRITKKVWLKCARIPAQAKGLVDLDTWYLDSTQVRASRSAAGAKKGGLKP